MTVSVRPPSKLHFDVQDISTIIAAIDAYLGETVTRRNYKLKALLRCLGIPHSKLHIAGTDATFVLRAMLALLIRMPGKGGMGKVALFRRDCVYVCERFWDGEGGEGIETAGRFAIGTKRE
jgi:hypothetical protein